MVPIDCNLGHDRERGGRLTVYIQKGLRQGLISDPMVDLIAAPNNQPPPGFRALGPLSKPGAPLDVSRYTLQFRKLSSMNFVPKVCVQSFGLPLIPLITGW